ncbi:5,10-methylenetetrahydrofolate reductase [Bradyrhizobium sp. LM6.9]
MTDVTTAAQTDRHQKRPAISFEFFPPKTEDMERNLWDTINRLAPLDPKFVSVTYGAGGSTRERTHSTISRILKETALLPAAHLTCVGASRGEIDEIVDRYHEVGVRHIVGLRGESRRRYRHALFQPSRRLPDVRCARRRHQEASRRHRSVGLGLPREAPRGARLRR